MAAQSDTIPEKTSYVVRFAGDSGDGIQLQGQQFTVASALGGHDLATLPDFPAEIRAPTGTRYGVSAFQIQFGGDRITTPGDAPDVLIAFNPAALVVNLPHLQDGATIITDENALPAQRLKRADLESNPLEDGSLDRFTVHAVPISDLTQEAVKPHGLGTKDSLRCKNFWALGPHALAVRSAPGGHPAVDQHQVRQRRAGQATPTWRAGCRAMPTVRPWSSPIRWFSIPRPEAALANVEYRTLTGAEAISLGLVAAGELADIGLMFCSYPITPASSVLHHLAGLEDAGVSTFQAEDEIAAVCAAIGASYGGKLGVTSSSGPGIALKTEALGSGRGHGAAASGAERAACRPFHRHAHQDRAVRSVSGGLRSKWRHAHTRGCRPLTRRLLRHGDRGGAHRAPAHDAGHAPFRWLHRQRLRALGVAGLRCLFGHRAPSARAGRRRRRVRAGPDQPRPGLGLPRPSGLRAPGRRHRKGSGYRQHLLRPATIIRP